MALLGVSRLSAGASWLLSGWLLVPFDRLAPLMFALQSVCRRCFLLCGTSRGSSLVTGDLKVRLCFVRGRVSLATLDLPVVFACV